MIQLLLDGDWVIYTAGFAGQKIHRCWVPDNPQQAVIHGNVTNIKAEIERMGYRLDGGHVYERIETDDVEAVLHTARQMIESVIARVEDRCATQADVQVLVDGDGNFRHRIATIRPYKGTRAGSSKPILFNDIRQYLLQNWDAEEVYDHETDDEMAIRQSAAELGESIICAVDKDMLQVPGLHFNPNKGFRRVTQAEGQLRLFVQAAMGDPVDNIAGAYKVGEKKAREAFDKAMPEEEKWMRLVDLYQASIDKYGEDIYGGLDAAGAALENMRLVYLRRQPNEVWQPPYRRV